MNERKAKRIKWIYLQEEEEVNMKTTERTMTFKK